MADPDHDRDDKAAQQTGDGAVQRRKRPYAKPAFRSEKVFETTALACGKISTTQLQCRLNRKLS